MSNFKIIPTVDSTVSWASFSVEVQPHLDINSSAEHVVNDIKCIIAQMITPDTSIDDALTVMKLSNRKSNLFVGIGTQLLGVISSLTLVSRVVLMVANRKGVTRAELTVADIMSPTHKMPSLLKNHVQRACIGDLKQTMQELGEAYIQVIDENNKMCGVISSTDISRVLDEPVSINSTAHSFKDCFDIIHEHEEFF